MRIGITLRMIVKRNGWLAVAIAAVFLGSTAQADVKLPNVFGDHMVLQQGQQNKVWGLAEAGEVVTVAINGQSQTATAAADGTWHVMIDPVPVGGPYALTVKGKNEIKFSDVLVGEVGDAPGGPAFGQAVAQARLGDAVGNQ